MTRYIFLGLLMVCSLSGFSQTNVDSIFNIAILQSRSSNYNVAINEAEKALKNDSLRNDIRVFIANVYSWKNENDSAIYILDKVAKAGELFDEYFDARLNVLLRMKNYSELLNECDNAQKSNYKDSTNLLTKRLLAQQGLEEYRSVVNLVDASENKEIVDNSVISSIYQQALDKLGSQSISVAYSADLFQDITPHHYLSTSYINKIENLSTSITLNYSNRYEKNDLQVEYTGYKILKSENYWYLNYGYAFNGVLFPKHRVGLEYYFAPAKKWEASIGSRYLFYPFADDKDTWIFTFHTGVYFGNSWLTFRPYYVVRNSAQALSGIIKYRLFESNPVNYWGVELGLGNSPDDMYASSQGSFSELMAYRVKVEKNISLSKRTELLLGAGYIFEEILQGVNINNRYRISLELGYKYKF